MKNKQPGMTLIVKTVTRLTVGLILIYGIYIVLQGHIGPGGGFAGGVIIALAFIHILLAFGKEHALSQINENRGLLVASVGALLFLLIVCIRLKSGPVGGHAEEFHLFAGGKIPLSDIAVAAMAGTALFVIFLALLSLTGRNSRR